jgi:hypothetical protein
MNKDFSYKREPLTTMQMIRKVKADLRKRNPKPFISQMDNECYPANSNCKQFKKMNDQFETIDSRNITFL